MTTPKLTVALDLDPTVMQSFAHQVTLEVATRTAADLHALQRKRNASTKPLLRHTRDQRAHDALNKRLPPDADMLTYLRRLAVGNYFCVPATQAVAVRNMTYREHAERGIKYTTTKFVYGREKFLKVQRHNPIND
jgi:antitoxin (DNA-binding transcriptional repressor) of toxin-antitoxin stability system